MARKLLGLMLVAVLLVSLSGCPAPARRPLGEEPYISLYDVESGQVQRLSIEKYVEGVVAAEMDTSWPVNALAAQAILARTFTMKKKGEGGVRSGEADVSTDKEESQAYDSSKINDNVRRAVAKTRGLVATYRGEYIHAWFHADSGGRTAASAKEGLDYDQEPTPYIKSVQDPGFPQSPPENKGWRASFPWEEVRQAVREASGRDPGPQPLAQITSKGPSGRATQVRVGEVKLSAPALRLALGSERMRSALLSSFRVEGASLVMEGKGYGHGVGLSQWGAKAMAEKGQKPEEIVKYFFQGIEIRREWQ